MTTNAEFIDGMLSDIQLFAINTSPLNIDLFIMDMLEVMKGWFERKKDFRIFSAFTAIQIKKIETRVEEMFHVMDAMYFVVGLYHRNQGGKWEDMDKYRQKTIFHPNAQKPNNRL